MKLSAIIPCFNEKDTILLILDKVLELNLDKEIVIVDDFSNDGTREILKNLNRDEVKVVYHEKNKGKGAAIRTGLQYATGDVVIIQDADLEYDPNDYYELVKPIEQGKVNVVFGSRFLGRHTGLYFWNALGNKFLTFLTNFLFNCWISDMETCYKVMKTDIMRSLNLRSNGFGIEPEITAKILKKREKIYEVPVSYMGRTYEEGKKINWKDGIRAIFTLIKFRFSG